MTQIRLLLLTLLITPALAFSDQSIADQYPGSILYSKPVELIPNVWTAIGATAPPTYENSGHNNNYTFVITAAGVVVVNSGSYLLAKALHDEIRQITNQPVVLVINENGQGHAMLGNGYWKEQGVAVLAHTDTIHEIEESGSASLAQLKRVTREKAEHSRVELPTETFSDKRSSSSVYLRLTSTNSSIEFEIAEGTPTLAVKAKYPESQKYNCILHICP